MVMGKKLTYFIVLAYSICLLFSCSNDNEDKNKIISDYAGTYSGNQLKVLVSDVEMADREAVINDDGMLILKNVVPGESSIEIQLSLSNGMLTGNTAFSGGNVSVTAGLDKNILSVDAIIQLNNALSGTWNLLPYTQNSNGEIISNPVFVNASPTDATVTIMGEEMNVGTMCYFLSGIIGVYASEIKSLTFLPDGFVIATMKNEVIGSTPRGLLQYYIKDNLIYFIPNLSAITELIGSNPKSRVSIDDLVNLVNMITITGVPLAYDIDNGELKIFVTKSMMQPSLQLIQQLVIPLLPDSNPLFVVVKDLYTEFCTAISSCTSFDIGMAFLK